MFTISQLQFVQAIAEHRSFRKAAASLNVSQSTLSRSIQDLEAETGLTLFDRDRNSVKLTVFGQRFLDMTSDLLAKTRGIEVKVKEMRDASVDYLRVGAGPLVAQTWISGALRAFSKSHPACDVEIDEAKWWELVDSLRAGRFDFIIGDWSDAEKYPEVVIERMPQRAACFVVRKDHPLGIIRDLTMKDIAQYPNVGPRLPAARIPGLRGASGMGHVSDDGRFFIPKIECAQLRTMLDVVIGSDAFCATFPQIIPPLIDSGRLHELPFKPKWLQTQYGLMHLRSRPQSGSARAFRQAAINAERHYFK